ncbi:MAG: hypothetical protein ACYDET_06640 [Thermoleophilia bacterium]
MCDRVDEQSSRSGLTSMIADDEVLSRPAARVGVRYTPNIDTGDFVAPPRVGVRGKTGAGRNYLEPGKFAMI